MRPNDVAAGVATMAQLEVDRLRDCITHTSCFFFTVDADAASDSEPEEGEDRGPWGVGLGDPGGGGIDYWSHQFTVSVYTYS